VTIRRHPPWTALALAALVAACGEPAGPDPLLSPNALSPQAKLVPSGAPLQMKAEYELEEVNQQSVREHVAMTAYFSADPVDPETGLPMEDFSFNFAKTDFGYKPNEKQGSMGGSVSYAWKPYKRGDGYEFEATDPQAVLDAVKLQVFEAGQAVADVTSYIRESSGRLFFNQNFKIWELRLGFTTVDLPSGIITPTMLKTLGGSSIATLHIDQTELTTRIRENEFSAQSAELVLNAETKIEDAGSGNVQELFAINTSFFSSELNPFAAAVDYFLKLEFEINYPGVVGPPCLQIGIPPGAWVQGDGGGFKLEASDPQVAGITFLVVENGQVVNDLSDLIGGVTGLLHYDIPTKSWQLRLEIAGVVIPSDVHAPMLAPLAGARTATLDLGNGLEVFSAPLRKNEGVF
jgi:hypothetical protein